MNHDLDDETLDRLLAALPREEPRPDFLRRVREIPLREPRAPEFRWRGLLGALGLSSALAAGFLLGLSLEGSEPLGGAETAELDLELLDFDLEREDAFDL